MKNTTGTKVGVEENDLRSEKVVGGPEEDDTEVCTTKEVDLTLGGRGYKLVEEG